MKQLFRDLFVGEGYTFDYVFDWSPAKAEGRKLRQGAAVEYTEGDRRRKGGMRQAGLRSPKATTVLVRGTANNAEVKAQLAEKV